MIVFLTLESFSRPLPYSSFKDKHKTKVISEYTKYHYDSVKVTSNYKFDNAAVAATQAHVLILYPVFTNTDLNNIVKEAILAPFKVKHQFNDTAAKAHPALSNMDAINNTASDYQGLAANFLKQFETQAPQEELRAYWYADIEVRVETDQSDYIALRCKKDYFTGGLHDLYGNTYLNYDVHDHKVFSLVSQLKGGKLSQLKAIAERVFRENESLTSTQELDGYFFENGKFQLPDNFTITAKGLSFLYDYYEIKPFAAGTTALVIPFAALKELVLPNSVLGRRIAKR